MAATYFDNNFSTKFSFSALGQQFCDPPLAPDQNMLLTLNLLPEITIAPANATASAVGELIDQLCRRQHLVAFVKGQIETVQPHDLLREFLDRHFDERFADDGRAARRTEAACILAKAGRTDDAIAMALRTGAWALARELLLLRADTVIAAGRGATFIEWLGRLPREEMTGWLLYWSGVAHLADDAAAERWLSRAWRAFEADGDRRGMCLTVARAIVSKTDNWRTHTGLAVWTERAIAIAGQDLPELSLDENLLVHISLVRACDCSDEGVAEIGRRLAAQLIARLDCPDHDFPAELRLRASETLIQHAMQTGEAGLFEQAVDHVAEDVRHPEAPSWHLGPWLVAFGAASGGHFRYARRGFRYATAEEALRAAIDIGEKETLKGVEIGALYHLQMLMRHRNDFSELGCLVARLAEIADSRCTTQVAIVADCSAAVHTLQGNFAEAYRDCERFMAAIEAANEPIIKRLPHYFTKFQVQLADRRPQEARDMLAELMPRLQGNALRHTELCIGAADALDAKWRGEIATYRGHLGALFAGLAKADWRAILLNLPGLLAELVADALDAGIETAFCLALIDERRLTPPSSRPPAWPWPLKVHVLGGFRLERDGVSVALGPKPPTRSLDILRILALSKDHACPIETVEDWLWPDLDGARANAACEQALHRLRRLLGQAKLIALIEGKLRLSADRIWVDLDEWNVRLKGVLAAGENTSEAEMQEVLATFPGPLFFGQAEPAWAVDAANRVRDGYVELSLRAGKRCEAEGTADRARATYLRALNFYPDSDRLNGALIEQRLNAGDIAGAAEDHQRYLRMLKAAGDSEPSSAIAALARKALQTQLVGVVAHPSRLWGNSSNLARDNKKVGETFLR